MLTETIRLHKAQIDFRRSQAVFRGYVGGRGAGKSFIGALDLIMRAKPGRHYGIYAPTYPLLRDASIRSFIEIGTRLHYIKAYHKSDKAITLGNGAQVICRSLDDPETARGPNLSGAWMDEASLIARDGFDIVIATLREDGEQGWLSATFTPKGRSHWTHKVFGQQGDKTAIFHSRTADNPFLPPDFAATLRQQYTSQFAAQEIDGQFIELQGTLCKREWFGFVDAAPSAGEICRSWDLAATAKTSADFTVGTKLVKHGGVFYVASVVRGQVEAGGVERLIRATAEQDGRRCTVYVEQEPGSSGKILGHGLITGLAGFVCRAIPVTGDKVTRAMPFLSQAEAGNVKLVRGAWNDAWLEELCAFPVGEHDDQVDSCTLGFNQLTERRSTAILF